MNDLLKYDLTHLDEILESARVQAFNYLNGLNIRETSVRNQSSKPNEQIEFGIGANNTLSLFLNKYEELIVASSGPRYWGFVTGGSTPASIIGDWLTSVFDQNPQAVKGFGDISANIEIETISLLLDLFDLPDDFNGGFVSGATMSNFTSLAVARQWCGRNMNINIALEGMTKNINILSSSAHSSILKSIAMLGIGSRNIIKVNSQENREAIDLENLVYQIEKLDNAPFILTTSAGTVNSVDFDDFYAISKLKEKYNFWWHIDAAFGAFASLSPSHKDVLKGWQYADSITIDCHKWLNVPYENAIFLINKSHKNLQMETFQNSNAPYLGDIMNDFNYLNLLPENSRRLKALPVWFTLVAYGKEGYKSVVVNSIKMAELFGEYVASNPHLILLADVRLNNVCFALKNESKNLDTKQLLAALNERGKVFMTPTFFNSRNGIRASFVNWRTNVEDVQIAMNELNEVLFEMGLKNF